MTSHELLLLLIEADIFIVLTGEHKRLPVLHVEVIGERGAHQHHQDVPCGGEEPQRLRHTTADARAPRRRRSLARHVYVLYFLEMQEKLTSNCQTRNREMIDEGSGYYCCQFYQCAYVLEYIVNIEREVSNCVGNRRLTIAQVPGYNIYSS